MDWWDPQTGELIEFEVPEIEVDVTPVEGPILYGPDGEPLGKVTDRPPFGFQP